MRVPGVPMGSMLSSYIVRDWPSTFSLFNPVRWLLGMLDKTTRNSMTFHEIPWRIQASGALGILGVPRSALLPVRLAFKAVGSSILCSCSRIRSRCSSSRPDGLVRFSCFSKSCFFSMEAWRIQHGKDDDDTDIHRMHMLQLNRQTYPQILFTQFHMYHKYIHTYRIITAGTVGVLRSARHGLVKQAASPPYGWF